MKSSPASALGRLSALALAAVLVATVSPAQATPAHERVGGQPAGAPGSLTGYGFDTCTTPAQPVMDAWWEESPYSAVGVYIGGSNRVCKDQPELTASWVQTQRQRGWHVLPIQVGPQASCSGYADKMSSDLATAEAQGRAEAATAIATAQALGIGPGSTLYYDLEDYDIAPDDCRRARSELPVGLDRRGCAVPTTARASTPTSPPRSPPSTTPPSGRRAPT